MQCCFREPSIASAESRCLQHSSGIEIMGCGASVNTENQAKKSEKAIKAAILIQQWYRSYTARLEMRRRYTLSIFQSIEYAEEQAQLQLSNFFTFMMDHFAQWNRPGPDLISDIFNSSSEAKKKLLDYEKVEVPDSYDGPRLSFPLTVSDTNALLHAFKQQQQLHARYVLQLFHETQKFLKQIPNVVHLSTSYFKEITICGDLHGKLDDLLRIFYKNGLPSPENPYLFNGDFVDRGKNSIEILIILFAFLLVYPNNFHLNRGNHEDPIMNLRYGFTKEVMQKYKIYGHNIILLLKDIYCRLPLATIIDSKVLILHGGIADTTDLDFLTTIERSKYKSALQPPKQSSRISHPKDTSIVQKANELSKDGWKSQDNSSKQMVTCSQNTQCSYDECCCPSIFSSSEEQTGALKEGFSQKGVPETPYLDSNIQLPNMTPELTAMERDEWKQYKSALQPPKQSSRISHPKDTSIVQKANELSKDGWKSQDNSSKQMVTCSQNTQCSYDECCCPSIFSSSEEQTSALKEGFSQKGVPETPYLDSNIQLPNMTPELTAMERYEWKQVVDLLWSDPRNQSGCSPNSSRGGGCYFGPDVTTKLLDKYNLKMLIRSHECKQEGYELCHNGKVVTIFSASNYYEEGSNKGAYLKLSPDLTPRFVQYQVSKCTRRLTLCQSVSAVEDSALRSLRRQFYTHRSELIEAFGEHDPQGTGRIPTSEWASAVEAVLHLDLPWRTLRSRLVRLSPDGSVEYLSCFEDLQMGQPIKKVQPSLIETLYRYRADLEIIFNIIDTDHSGLISIEEFRQTWKLFSSHLHINIDDSTIVDLIQSMDSNKDGSIDFNEFLEAFCVVQKFEMEDNKARQNL
ncbi:serine/threonine-protein phosphatase with EF-hands 1 isoform X2 [Ascaphus truei]|uniref:serine/threonine-protein phosphatase with EF-hands 1 isoform X2 n=1 Tax=Ascaphus truei TaxID=8439 RepID=UPI003F5A729A